MSSRPLFVLVLGVILVLGFAQAWWLSRTVARRIRTWQANAPLDGEWAQKVTRFVQYGLFGVQIAAYVYAVFLLAPLIEQFLGGSAAR